MRRPILMPAMTCVLISAIVSLTGCDSPSKTTVTLNGDSGASGRVAIDAPGFQGNFTLPRIQVQANDFDLDGVHLYPGSRIVKLDIDGREADGREKPIGTVKARFDSPAPPATVRDWFEAKLAHSGRKLHRDGTGLSGTTEAGDPFRLDLVPTGAGHSDGTITVGD